MKKAVISFAIVLAFLATACSNQAGPTTDAVYVGYWYGPAHFDRVEYEVFEMTDSTFISYVKYDSWPDPVPGYKGFLKDDPDNFQMYVVTTHIWEPKDHVGDSESNGEIIYDASEGNWVTVQEDLDSGGAFSEYAVRESFAYIYSGDTLNIGGQDYTRVDSLP